MLYCGRGASSSSLQFMLSFGCDFVIVLCYSYLVFELWVLCDVMKQVRKSSLSVLSSHDKITKYTRSNAFPRMKFLARLGVYTNFLFLKTVITLIYYINNRLRSYLWACNVRPSADYHLTNYLESKND